MLFSRRTRFLSLQNAIESQSCGPMCIWSSKMIDSAHSCRVCGKLEAYLESLQSLESALMLVWCEMMRKDFQWQPYQHQLDSQLRESIIAALGASITGSPCVGTVRIGRAK